MKLTKHACSSFLHSAIVLFEIRTWKKARKLLHPYQHRSSERMNIVFHHWGCGQNSMVPDRQIQRMSLCFHRSEKNNACRRGFRKKVLFSALRQGSVFYRSWGVLLSFGFYAACKGSGVVEYSTTRQEKGASKKVQKGRATLL